ncbi:MAG: FKBP-type peptidyl-prolyl cis-trans isomerase [Chitinophagaceae bacterium]|nr:FKBP-type peptidyl-prolyl cis-trans isomerase [Chitinophagaceae bacterium]
MQKILILLFSLVGTVAIGQTTSKKAATPSKPASKNTTAATPLRLKNQTDSFSYAIGVSIANFYREQGISNISSALVTKAINDCNVGKPALKDGDVNNIIMTYMQQARSQKSSAVRKEGEAFLLANKSKPGVITTASGLQYSIIKEGTGPKPLATDRVKVHYHGTTIKGEVFDSSVDRGQPYTSGVTDFIQGWVEALQLMPAGSKWRLFIPSNLAYGDSDSGPLIKAGSALVFDIELIEVVGK